MMLENLISCRMHLQLLVNLIRQPLPSAFAKEIRQLFFRQFMIYNCYREVAEILFPFPGLLFPFVSDFFEFRFNYGFLTGSLNFIKKGFLSVVFHLLAFSAVSIDITGGKAFQKNIVL